MLYITGWIRDCGRQVLTERSSRPEVLSCTFYNVLHDRHSNVLYNFRFPRSGSRCRVAEWRRHQHSPAERRHCRKWFVGTSRDRQDGGGRVAVVRGRAAPRRALTVVDNGSLATLRRVNKSVLSVFPPIRVRHAVDSSSSSTFRVRSPGVTTVRRRRRR